MAGRWSCVALVVVLVVACRTPKKEVSIYPLDDDESGNARHRHTSSDAGNAVTGRVELPNCAGTETATNSTVVAAPATNNTPTAILPPANTKPPVADKLPAPATVKTEALHLKSSELPPMAAPTNTTAHLGLPGLSGSQSFAPVSQPIHLSLPAWTTPQCARNSRLGCAQRESVACNSSSATSHTGEYAGKYFQQFVQHGRHGADSYLAGSWRCGHECGGRIVETG